MWHWRLSNDAENSALHHKYIFFKYSKIETYFYIVLISYSIAVFTVFLFKYNLDETFQKHKKILHHDNLI